MKLKYEKKSKFHYRLGNILRGWMEGEFTSDEVAWRILSKQFDDAFPSEEGRHVVLIKEETVKIGKSKNG